jgi:hypothetical protein
MSQKRPEHFVADQRPLTGYRRHKRSCDCRPSAGAEKAASNPQAALNPGLGENYLMVRPFLNSSDTTH